MRRLALVPALPVLLFAGYAAAAPATADGAAALTATFQTYLGSAPGVISVTPSNDHYAVRLDFAPILAKLPEEGAEIGVSPLVFDLADSGNGIWEMTQDQALRLTVKVPGQIDMDLKVANLTSSGTFDAALGAFSVSSSTLTNISLAETVPDPALGETHLVYTVGAASYESKSSAGSTGGVDMAATYQLRDVYETFTVPGQNGGEPAKIKADVARYDGDAQVIAMRPDALYRLAAFLVEHPEAAAIAAHQDDLKAIIRGGLPVFQHMISNGSMADVGVDTPVGHIDLANVTMQIELNGLIPDGLLREAFNVTGLTLPDGMVPDWAKDLVPQTMGLDFSMTGYDVATPLALFLDTIDLTKPKPVPDALEDQLLAKFLPKGTLTLSLAPAAVTSPLYSLTYEGSLAINLVGAPTGKALVTMTGMQAVRDAVKAAPPDPGMQIALVLGAAEGAAKRSTGGVLTWDMEMTETGLLVNGVNLSNLGKK